MESLDIMLPKLMIGDDVMMYYAYSRWRIFKRFVEKRENADISPKIGKVGDSVRFHTCMRLSELSYFIFTVSKINDNVKDFHSFINLLKHLNHI